MKFYMKNNRFNSFKMVIVLLLLSTVVTISCTKLTEFYSADDFNKIEKIDAHFHYNIPDPGLLLMADSVNFKIVTINTRTINDGQFDAARTLKKQYPDKITFLGTFSAEIWNEPYFVDSTVKRIEMVLNAGAVGIKIWKNIGMVIQDSTGKYLMIDDPIFEPILAYLEENEIQVVGHFGEPKNCWLPFEEMTVKSNKGYYTNHPEYHMHLHPEAPSYEDHLRVRDNMLERHPNLKFIGAHLASLEWSIDELSKWLDKFPNATVDMAGRIYHLQYQSLSDREKVRNFLIKYQDRILYATDRSIRPRHKDLEKIKQGVFNIWKADWIYLATDSVFQSRQVDYQEVKGLQLPKKVIDKIYFKNAEYLFE